MIAVKSRHNGRRRRRETESWSHYCTQHRRVYTTTERPNFVFSLPSALLAKRVIKFESSFERFILSMQWLLAWFLGMLCFVASCTYVVVSLLYCFMPSVQCGYLYIAYAVSFFCFSIFMINNDLYSVVIILWLVCDNVVSTVRFSVLKLVKFSFLFLLFATGFISPVNKE